jgi:hypothetical protein
MVNFEENERDFIRSIVRNVVQNVRIGEVAQVYSHVRDDDGSNFEADVLFPEEDEETRVAPIQGPHSNSIAVPKVGDKVVVEYIHGDKKNPIIRNIIHTDENRAPKGEAGMWRKRLDSGVSSGSVGDLFVTAHTRYNNNPAIDDYNSSIAEQAFFRVAKKDDAMDESNLPMTLEVYDDSVSDDAYIKAEANKVDGSDSAVPYGFKVDLNDGSFTIIDSDGYGIESDGSGNFTWYYETIDYNQGSTTTLPLK